MLALYRTTREVYSVCQDLRQLYDIAAEYTRRPQASDLREVELITDFRGCRPCRYEEDPLVEGDAELLFIGLEDLRVQAVAVVVLGINVLLKKLPRRRSGTKGSGRSLRSARAPSPPRLRREPSVALNGKRGLSARAQARMRAGFEHSLLGLGAPILPSRPP